MNLYDITTEMQGVLDAMLDGGIDSPEAQAALDEHLSGLDAALDAKAEAYAGIVRELESRAEARKVEASRIRNLAAADEALAARLKDRLKAAMEQTGRLKIDTPRFRLSVAGNGGKQPLDIDPAHMDSWAPPFRTVTVVPNREAIRIALENGGEVPGCTLLPRGTGLRIK